MINQDIKTIALYSHKLTGPQTRYTGIEEELLSVVENLKEFRTILLGQKLKIYRYHKNLTCKNFNTDRVLWWRLILEEYIPEIEYIQVKKYIVADALS